MEPAILNVPMSITHNNGGTAAIPGPMKTIKIEKNKQINMFLDWLKNTLYDKGGECHAKKKRNVMSKKTIKK